MSSVNIVFLPSQFRCLLFLFLAYLLWLQLLIQCWVEVVGMGTVVLFLILEENFSHSFTIEYVCCGIFVESIIVLKKLLSIPSFFDDERVLDFKCLFCINWGDNVFLFSFCSINAYYIDWFYVEPLLHSWDKLHLVMMYNCLNMLLNLVY